MSYEIHKFKTARQLLEYLNPLDKELWRPGQTIFRGQPKSSQPLLPSIHRLKGPVTATRFYGDPDVSCEQQVNFEQKVLLAFLEACDHSGLKVPGDSPDIRQKAKQSGFLSEPGSSWPSQDLHEVLAFAQHHGVPTCLLDWSRSAYVAAYFAASSAMAELRDSDQELEGDLAIWALSNQATGFDIIQPPGGTSPYLAAQSGLFTVSRVIGPETNPFLPIQLELAKAITPGPDGSKYLQRLTLPRAEAADLLEGCAVLGVTGSKLFPGYEGIAKSVKDWANINHQGSTPIEDSIRYLLS